MTQRKPNTTCHECGNACYIRPNQMAKQSTWFCSRECYSAGRAKEGFATNLVCPQCQVSFNSKSRDRIYCSRKCSNEARTGIKYTGERLRCNVSKSTYRRNTLTELYGYQCSLCKLGGEWNGKPITLQVDHINGNNKDNSIENLRLLCPNCHSQTETFGAGNIGRWPK